jgi:hypothetical protein
VEEVPFLLRASSFLSKQQCGLRREFFALAIPNMSTALLRVNSARWQREQIFHHQSLRGYIEELCGPKNALTFGACRFVR